MPGMLSIMKSHGGFELVWEWESNEQACYKIKSQYPKIKIGISAKQIIKAPNVVLAYIAILPSSHHKYLMIVAVIGKVTFCETLHGWTSRIVDSLYKFWKS